MKSRLLAIFLAPSVLLAAPTAGARPNCSALIVESGASFLARWPSLLESVRDEFTARNDIDRCARVELSVDGDGIGVSVALPDGRVASRSVTRSVDVVPTLEALLLVPAHAAADPKPRAPSPPPIRAPKPSLDAGDQAERANDEPASAWSPGTVPRRLGFELSLITSARVGDGQVGIGAGVLSFLEVHGWLAGFEGRVDGYTTIVGSDRQGALALALLGGRRFQFDGVALDLTAGPAVAMKGMASSESVHVKNDGAMPVGNSTPPPAARESSTGPLPRLLLGARVGFQARSAFRTFVGIDGELGPRQSSTAPEGSTRLPAFAVGLALGATLGKP